MCVDIRIYVMKSNHILRLGGDRAQRGNRHRSSYAIQNQRQRYASTPVSMCPHQPPRHLTEIGNAAKICFQFGKVMGEVALPPQLVEVSA